MMTVVYGIIFTMSLLLLPGYFLFVRNKRKEPWLFMLFIFVALTDLGWLLLSAAKTLDFALLANKIAYLGQIFMPACIFLIISRLCGYAYKRLTLSLLLTVGLVVFAMVCTTGYLDWYYADAHIIEADGATKLVKEYGPLHSTYPIYVISYFVAMIGVIIVSICKKKGRAHKLAGLMLMVVLCNISTWIVEKFVNWNFEFLSISYLMSEYVFFFIYLVLQDYVHVDDLPPPVIIEERAPVIVVDNLTKAEKIQRILSVLPEGMKLSARQTDILEGILDGKTRKEMAADLHLSENTVKMHTSSLYRLLDVSSRDEIYALFKD